MSSGFCTRQGAEENKNSGTAPGGIGSGPLFSFLIADSVAVFFIQHIAERLLVLGAVSEHDVGILLLKKIHYA